MAGWGEEYESQIRMMERAYVALQEQVPDHPLFEHAQFNKDTQEWLLQNEWWDKYEVENGRNIHAYAGYTIALEEALKEHNRAAKAEQPK